MLQIKIIDKNDMLGGGTPCDGCNVQFELGDKMITGIESCCGGGCCRVLCQNCIKGMFWEMMIIDIKATNEKG